MSFIDSLDISEEENKFYKSLNTKFDWCCDCSVSNSLFGSSPTCSFVATNKQTGKSSVVLTVEWTHSVPQLVGHTILSGRWSVSDVKFSGSIVESANRLNTVRSVIGNYFRKAKQPQLELPSAREAELQLRISQLQNQAEAQNLANQNLQKSLLAEQEHVKLLTLQVESLQQSLKLKDIEISELRNKFSDKATSALGEEPAINPNNVSIFSQWAETPEAE
nr:hypothetical protein [Cassava torrado-like virus 2]